MERLSFIDQALHKLATSGLAPVDMQGVMVLDPAKAPFKVTPELLAEHMAARLANKAVLRKKLVQDSLGINDVQVVDDPDFDILEHIRFAELPAPGDPAALAHRLGQFSADPLELDRPLWRFEIISGLADGRIAIAQKFSHATMDGMAAMEMMGALFDAEPLDIDAYEEPDWTPDPVPTKIRLLLGAIRDTGAKLYLRAPSLIGRQSIDILRKVRGGVGRKAEVKSSDKKAENAPKKEIAKPKRTSLNNAISSDHRVIAYRSFDLDRIKKLSRRLDCTINDTCLMMVEGALTSYFDGVGENIDFDLRGMIPLSTRAKGDTKAGNAIAVTQINLHNTEADPLKRLRAIQSETAIAKTSRSDSMAPRKKGKPSVKPTEYLDLLSPLILDVIATAFAKLKPWSKMPVVTNTLITNVPGPRERVYVAGMPIEEQIPVIPVGPTCALNVGIVSMEKNLTIGFHGCGEVVAESNMHYLLEGLESALRTLEATDDAGASSDKAAGKAKRPRVAKSRATAATKKPPSRKAKVSRSRKVVS